MTGDDFSSFLDSSLQHLTGLNEQLEREFNMGHWETWRVDLETATLTFSAGGKDRVRATVRVVGTTSAESRTFRWGWANPHLPAAAVEGMARVREFGAEEDLEPLTWETIEEDAGIEVGWEMTAMAVRILEGKGCYRYRSGTGLVYLLINDVAHLG